MPSISSFSYAFPPAPTFTDANLPSLKSKVFLVTGANSGVGFHLTNLLYSKDATVYMAGRSRPKLEHAMKEIQSANSRSKGRLELLIVDLSDLRTIKPAANEFSGKESRLDVLFHNAGVMQPPKNSKSKQGYDLEMGTNCLGPFLLNKLLEPVLFSTASHEAPGEVRVVWVTSLLTGGVTQGGVEWDNAKGPKVLKNAMNNYMQSKVGNTFLAKEWGDRVGREKGILSVSVHPGLMSTELARHMNPLLSRVFAVIFKSGKHGAYSELYSGFSNEVTMDDSGGWLVAWGRKGQVPEHIEKGMKSQAVGGTGLSSKFWEWCEEETKAYC